MREIKFRAWDKDLKGWIAEKFWVSDGVVWIRRGDMLVKLEAELVQFTGLLDKNGQEIYEGDICQSYTFLNNMPLTKFIVEMKVSRQNVVMHTDVIESQISQYLLSLPDRVEIIGNIYDNPDLLNQ